MQDLALLDDWRMMPQKKIYPDFHDFTAKSTGSDTQPLGLLLERYLEYPETLTLVTKTMLRRINGLGARRIAQIERVLDEYGLSLLQSPSQFPAQFTALYDPSSEDTPIEAIELVTGRKAQYHGFSGRTVRDARAMMRVMPRDFVALAHAVGIGPAEGPLCRNGLFVHDKSQILWDVEPTASNAYRHTNYL